MIKEGKESKEGKGGLTWSFDIRFEDGKHGLVSAHNYRVLPGGGVEFYDTNGQLVATLAEMTWTLIIQL